MKYILACIFFIGMSVLTSIGQNNAPVAVPDSLEVMEQVQVLIDVKANDYDPDGDQILLNSVNPNFGEVQVVDEHIQYRSFPGISYDYFRYSIRDDQSPPLISSHVMVKITLLYNPDIPVAVADTFELMKLLPHNINLVSNDYDLNGDAYKINEIRSTRILFP